MNSAAPAVLSASRCAEQILQELEITSLDVNPFTIAMRRHILVQPKHDPAPGVSGLLMKVGDSFGIMYSTYFENEGYERFSVAHELGHYFLPGHADAVIGPDGIHESRAGFASGDRYELEADHFAANLLMPKRLFVAALRTAGSGVDAIKTMSGLCKTSLTATAIRLAQCTDDPLAVVLSTGNQIDWCFISDELEELKGIDWIRKGQILPRNSATSSFNRDAERIRRAERANGSSDLQSWFGGPHQIDISEDIVGLGSSGKTLTVLHEIELPDPEGDDEEVPDSWSPRFRR